GGEGTSDGVRVERRPPPTARPAQWRQRSGSGAPSPAYPTADFRQGDAQAYWLHHVIHGPRLEAAQLFRLAAVNGGEDDAKLAGALLLQCLENRVAIEGRKVDVQKQEGRRATRFEHAQDLQRFASVAEMAKPVAPRLEAKRQQIGERRIVLDHDDLGNVGSIGCRLFLGDETRG